MKKTNKNPISTRNIVLCSLFAALIIVGTYIKIPIPPVPVTLQTMLVLLAGLVLGSWSGTISVLLYIFLGLAGLPVFTGGSGGISYLLSPTFGYILGFLIAAYISGAIAKGCASYKRTLAAAFAAMAVIYLCGMLYYCAVQTLYLNADINIQKFLISFFLLPLPKDIATCFAVAAIARRIKKSVNPGGQSNG